MVSSSFTIAGHSPAELTALWAAMEFGHFLPVSRSETLEFGHLAVMNRATADFVPHFVAQGLDLRHHGADPA